MRLFLMAIQECLLNFNNTTMKKILFSLLLAVITVGVMSCKENKPTKSAEEIKADSIAQAKKDSIKSIADFKKESIAIIDKHLKRNVSCDPDFGKVLETKDKILNDSIYFAVARVVWKNQFGATMQHDEFWFAFCRRDKKDLRLIFWKNDEYCNTGMRSIVGDNFSAYAHINTFYFPEEKYGVFVEELCSNRFFKVESWFN